jgi:hypothetical protein
MANFNKSLHYQISRKFFQSVLEFIHTKSKADGRTDGHEAANRRFSELCERAETVRVEC